MDYINFVQRLFNETENIYDFVASSCNTPQKKPGKNSQVTSYSVIMLPLPITGGFVLPGF